MSEKSYNSLKKIILKICLTLFCTFLAFLLLDIIVYSIDWIALKKHNEKFGGYLIPYKYSLSLNKYSYDYILDEKYYRKPTNTQSNLKPIYIFGCSFAYGEGLSDNETIDANLAKITKRPVYNFAYPGFSVQHMLYQLENIDFSKYKKPEYIIYFYMQDHLRRIQTPFMQPHETNRYPIYYTNNKGDFVFKKNRFDIPFYIVKKIQCFYAKYKTTSPDFEKNNNDLLKNHFLKANSIIKEKFPDSKFIIVLYEQESIKNKAVFNDLKKYGIEVISTKEITSEKLSDKKYKLIDNHPSALAWKEITPKLVKTTGM
ncbi:MAG: hypothetical protein ACI37Z_00215 [Candidatus Gastranaerophilaceae bacterium]